MDAQRIVYIAAVLWGGTSKYNIHVLKGLQKRAKHKFILHYPDQDYKERLWSLVLLPLTVRKDKFVDL